MLRAVKTTIHAGLTRRDAPAAIRLETRLLPRDRLGALALRLGIGRDRAVVSPGLYYTGNPGPESPVLVTANYRLTVDALRRELGRVCAWVLVIDTGGINVWCAAGKGSFNARGVVSYVSRSDLDRLAPSAPLVLPQLSASGVDAHALAGDTGRRVVFGPVYARDLPRFLESGLRKDESMRAVRFTAGERLALVPVELMHSGLLYLAALLLSALVALPSGPGFLSRAALTAAYLEGSLLVAIAGFPLLLPILPGRLFSVRGVVLHGVWSAAFFAITKQDIDAQGIALHGIAGLAPFAVPLFLLSGGVTSYLALNFTGSSTFTSQRGVEREVKKSVPIMIGSVAAGLLASAVLVIRNLLLAGGIR